MSTLNLQELQALRTDALVDLLAEYTAKYTRLFAEKNYNDEYQVTSEKIKNIQIILAERIKNTSGEKSLFIS